MTDHVAEIELIEKKFDLYASWSDRVIGKLESKVAKLSQQNKYKTRLLTVIPILSVCLVLVSRAPGNSDVVPNVRMRTTKMPAIAGITPETFSVAAGPSIAFPVAQETPVACVRADDRVNSPAAQPVENPSTMQAEPQPQRDIVSNFPSAATAGVAREAGPSFATEQRAAALSGDGTQGRDWNEFASFDVLDQVRLEAATRQAEEDVKAVAEELTLPGVHDATRASYAFRKLSYLRALLARAKGDRGEGTLVQGTLDGIYVP